MLLAPDLSAVQFLPWAKRAMCCTNPHAREGPHGVMELRYVNVPCSLLVVNAHMHLSCWCFTDFHTQSNNI
jgi:hypothetical protein